MGFAIVIIGGGILFFLATCWAIIDIARKDFGGMDKKLIWGLITLIPFIGPILYICVGYRKGVKPQST
ncbi:MAG: PLDc N-terminal domain-containing protein [Deltaproteobacteria bacterium]|nr:PLDc N-terminal domain-containing protein [Deltaproteobacteria bacterium]MBW1962165.1 PLDc N-terminal domain-containing protein [Deltaproteobacteria bacterium]MBW1994479.1 PLDc N-terminal domain-containing protein [Deltaproteobacteria bacterium]MBW2152399.1 PLDc N-terminal domain-containing protein [Deltaproteobacteria bacterium]